MSTLPAKSCLRSTPAVLSRAAVPLLFGLLAVSFLDRTNVGFAALRMNADLGFSPAVFGFGAGLFSIGEALCAVPSGLMAQRVGAGRWIALLALMWGALAVAMGAVGSSQAFFILRFLLGAAEAGLMPSISAYLSGWIEPAHRGRALAIVTSGGAFAAVLGGPLAGWLFQLDGLAGLPGWRWLFVGEGLPAMLGGLLALRWLAPVPQTEVAAVALSGSRQTSSAGSGIRALIEFIRAYPAILLMGAINFCITTGVLGALLWIPLIAAEIHGSTVMQVGWISAAVFSGGALGMLIVGALSDRSGRRFSFLTGCLIVAPLGYALAATTHDPTVRLVALGVGTAFMRSSAGDFFVGATERLPPDLRSSGLGILAAFGGLGGFTGPTLLGLVRERTGSFSAALLVLAGLLLIGALLGAHVARDFRHRSR